MELENFQQAKEIFKTLIDEQKAQLELFRRTIDAQHEVNNDIKQNESLLFETMEKMNCAIAELDKRLSKLEQNATT